MKRYNVTFKSIVGYEVMAEDEDSAVTKATELLENDPMILLEYAEVDDEGVKELPELNLDEEHEELI